MHGNAADPLVLERCNIKNAQKVIIFKRNLENKQNDIGIGVVLIYNLIKNIKKEVDIIVELDNHNNVKLLSSKEFQGISKTN